MAWDLAGNARGEIRRARFIEALGPERAAELLPSRGIRADDPVGEGMAGRRALGGSHAPFRGPTGERSTGPRRTGPYALGLGAGDGGLGSNSWVLAGSRTASGKPILANDPHLGLRTPSVWYLASIDAPGLRATARRCPAIPGVLIGHNDRIAWGLTSLEPDVQDLFVEEVDPDDASRYRHRGEWKRVRRAPGADPRPRAAGRGADGADSVHGPIVTDAFDGAESARARRRAALDWTGPGSRLDGGLPGHRLGRQLDRVPCRRGGDPRLLAQPGLRRRRGPHRLRRRRRDADPAAGRRSASRLRGRRGRLDGHPARRRACRGRSIRSAATSSPPTTALSRPTRTRLADLGRAVRGRRASASGSRRTSG